MPGQLLHDGRKPESAFSGRGLHRVRYLHVRLRSRRGGLELPRPGNWSRGKLEFWVSFGLKAFSHCVEMIGAKGAFTLRRDASG